MATPGKAYCRALYEVVRWMYETMELRFYWETNYPETNFFENFKTMTRSAKRCN